MTKPRIKDITKDAPMYMEPPPPELRELLMIQFEAFCDCAKLSDAEKEICFLLLKGMAQADIMAIMGKSRGSVRSLVSEIYKKSGVSSRAEMTQLIYGI